MIRISFPAVIAIGLLVVGSASAATLTGTIYEGFNYTVASSLGGQNGGSGTGSAAFTAAWGQQSLGGPYAQSTLSSGSLTYTNGATLQTSANMATSSGTGGTITNNYRNINQSGSVIDSGTLYFSYLVQKTNASNSSLAFALFGTDGGVQTERMGFGQYTGGSNAGNFQLYYNDTATYVNPGANLAVGNTTHMIVGRIDFNFSGSNERVTIYADPNLSLPEASQTIFIQNTTKNFNNIDAIRIFASNANSGVSGNFDEIRLGSTFASVTPVPEPASVILLALGIVGIVAMARLKRICRVVG